MFILQSTRKQDELVLLLNTGVNITRFSIHTVPHGIRRLQIRIQDYHRPVLGKWFLPGMYICNSAAI